MKVLQFLKVNVSMLLVLLSLAVFSTGCNDDDPAAVSVSKEIILVGSDAQAIPVTIMSNTNWTAESNSPWVRLSKTSGRGTTDIEVLIEACTAVNDRSAMITVKANGKSAIIDITQSATAGLLVIAPDNMAIGNVGGIVSFVIASNSPWTISSSNEWAVPSVTSGNGNATVNVTVASNESHFVARKATLSVTTGQGANAIVREFTVDQLSRALPHVTVAQKAISFAHNAKTALTNEVLIPIVSNVTGSINAHTDFSWATATVETIQGVKYVRIVCESDNADNNNRDCIVNVQAHVEGEATIAQIRVTQAGLGSPEIVMFRNTVALECDAATAVPVNYFFPNNKNITVQAVSEEPRWITNVKVDAAKKQITFNVEKNISAEARVGTIMVTATLGNETLLYPITVTQNGIGEVEVEVIPSSLSVGAMFNLTAKANVTSQTSYSTLSAVVTDASWLTVTMGKETTNNGSYAQEIIVTATPNAMTASRTATVTLTISYGDKLVLRTISVTQAGIGSPYLVVMPQDVVVDNGSHNLEANNIKITYLRSDEYVTIDAVSMVTWMNAKVVTDKIIAINIPEENLDEADRVGIVNVSVTRDGETVIYPVKVTQRGLGAIDVRIAPEVITLDAEVSAAQFVVSAQLAGATIDALVSSGAPWLTYEKVGDATSAANYKTQIYKVKATQNVDADPRTGTVTVTTVWGNKTDVRTVTVVQNGLGAPGVSTVMNAYMLSDQITHTQSLWLEDGNDTNVRYEVTNVSYQSGTNNVKTQTGWITNVSVANHNLVITAQKNTYDEVREGEITIIASRGTSKKVLTVHVTQAGHLTPGMTGLPTMLTHDYREVVYEPLQFSMLNNSTIKQVYTSHQEWLTVTKTSDNTIVYSLKEYNGGEQRDYREGIITIVVENGHSNLAVYTVAVHQLSPEMPGILHLPELITRDYEATTTGTAFFSFYLQNSAKLNASDISVEYTSGTTKWLTIEGLGNQTSTDGLRTLYYGVGLFQGGEEGGFREAVITIPVSNHNANKVVYKVRVRQYAPEMPGLRDVPENIVLSSLGTATAMTGTGSTPGYVTIPYSLQNATQNSGYTSGIIRVMTSLQQDGDTNNTNDWLKAAYVYGQGLMYSAAPFTGDESGNVREAYIYVTVKNNHANEATYTIPVRQYAPTMPGIANIPTTLGFGSYGTGTSTTPGANEPGKFVSLELNPINGSTLKDVKTSASWIHITHYTSDNNGAPLTPDALIEITGATGKNLSYLLNYWVEPYDGDTPRTGWISVKASNSHYNDVIYYIPITQYGSTYAYVQESENYTVYVDDLRQTAIAGSGTSSSFSHVFSLANLPAGATVEVGTLPENITTYCGTNHGTSPYYNCSTTIGVTTSPNSGAKVTSGNSITVNVGFSYVLYTGGASNDHVTYPTGTFNVPVTITTANYTQYLTLSVSVIRKN